MSMTVDELSEVCMIDSPESFGSIGYKTCIFLPVSYSNLESNIACQVEEAW